jgi:hypothetical protein
MSVKDTLKQWRSYAKEGVDDVKTIISDRLGSLLAGAATGIGTYALLGSSKKLRKRRLARLLLSAGAGTGAYNVGRYLWNGPEVPQTGDAEGTSGGTPTGATTAAPQGESSRAAIKAVQAKQEAEQAKEPTEFQQTVDNLYGYYEKKPWWFKPFTALGALKGREWGRKYGEKLIYDTLENGTKVYKGSEGRSGASQIGPDSPWYHRWFNAEADAGAASIKLRAKQDRLLNQAAAADAAGNSRAAERLLNKAQKIDNRLQAIKLRNQNMPRVVQGTNGKAVSIPGRTSKLNAPEGWVNRVKWGLPQVGGTLGGAFLGYIADASADAAAKWARDTIVGRK